MPDRNRRCRPAGAHTYLDLLDDLRIIERVPAWSSNRLERLVRAPKLYVADIEIKAANAVKPQATRHLEWLRDSLGSSFKRGVIFHTGDSTYPLGERIWAMPIASVWR